MKRFPIPTASPPTNDDIRLYAYHLYCQGGRIPDRELDNWLEAEACLRSTIPRSRSHPRLHHHLKGSEAKKPPSHPVAA